MAITAYEWSDRLRPYRWRVRLLLAWKLGAIGGTAGALTSALLSVLDWRAVLTVPTAWLPMVVLTGVFLGVAYALLIRLPDSVIAQLIDRRAGLKDRLQTAIEHSDARHLFDQPLIEDARQALHSARPRQIFRPRWTRWQTLFVAAVALAVLMHFLPQILAVAIPERRAEQKEIVESAKQIEKVVKPLEEEAKKPNADELAKRIVQNAELYNKRAREAKMSKQEALLRYNQLLEDARKLEQKNTERMQSSAQKALTAGEQLQQLAQKKQQQLQQMQNDLQAQLQQIQQQLDAGKDLQGNPLSSEQRVSLQSQMRQLQATLRAMQNPANTQNLQSQINELEKRLQELQKQLQSGKDAKGNPLSKEQMEALRKQIEQLQQQMRALQLSKEAQEFLRKLYNDPAFKEAMEHLRKLAEEMRKNMQQQQNSNNSQRPQLTPEEIEERLRQLEKQIEELAKKYQTDEQIHQLAQQILEQIKQMKKLNQCNGACAGLGTCFGLGAGMGGIRQGPAWDKGEYMGQPELFNQGDKQPELKIPLKDTAITGQQPLLPGPAEYQDFEAPPVPGGSSVPLSKALPTYQKKAEQALNQQNIPPAERKRVKRYFESLQKGVN